MAKEKRIADKSRRTKLFLRDDRFVTAKMAHENKTESEVIRELVATGRRTLELREAGKDDTMLAVREAQRKVVDKALEPLIQLLEEQKQFIENRASQNTEDYAAIEGHLRTLNNNQGVLLEGFERIVQNIVVIRALIWHYVTVFYYQVMREKGTTKTNHQLYVAYNKEVVRARIEALEKKVTFDDKEIEAAARQFGLDLISEVAHPTRPPESKRKPL